MPAGRIRLRHLVELAGEMGRARTGKRTGREWGYLDKLTGAMKDAAGDATLEDMLAGSDAPGAPKPATKPTTRSASNT
jgi:hypothetical protein